MVADLTDRRAVRRALQGRLARLPRRRLDQPAGERGRAVRGQRGGDAGACWRSACGRRSSASCTPPRSPPSGRRRQGGTADERQLWRGGLGIPYVDAKHEAEVEALRIAARGLPVVVVCPAYVLGRGDSGARRPSSCGASCCGGSPPTSRARSTWSTSRTSRRGCCSPTQRGVPGERYILGNRNYTWDRLFADLARLSGIEPPALRLLGAGRAGAGRDARARARPDADHAGRGAQRRAAGGPTARPRRGASWAGRRGRTRRRSRRPSTGTASARRGRLARIGTRQAFGWRAAGFAVRRIGELVP